MWRADRCVHGGVFVFVMRPDAQKDLSIIDKKPNDANHSTVPDKEPCTKTAGRGPVPFYPSPSRGVRVIYLFISHEKSRSFLDLVAKHLNFYFLLEQGVTPSEGRALEQQL